MLENTPKPSFARASTIDICGDRVTKPDTGLTNTKTRRLKTSGFAFLNISAHVCNEMKMYSDLKATNDLSARLSEIRRRMAIAMMVPSELLEINTSGGMSKSKGGNQCQ